MPRISPRLPLAIFLGTALLSMPVQATNERSGPSPSEPSTSSDYTGDESARLDRGCADVRAKHGSRKAEMEQDCKSDEHAVDRRHSRECSEAEQGKRSDAKAHKGRSGEQEDEDRHEHRDCGDHPAENNHLPSCADAVAEPARLWPPNHQFSRIAITGVLDPDGETPDIQIHCIAQDEPLNAGGDGSTEYDASVQGSAAMLRAERSGKGDGRVYHIAFSATDKHGAACSGEVLVGVPHDADSIPVDSGPLYASLANAAGCGAPSAPPPTITAPADLIAEATGPTTALEIGVAQSAAGDGSPLVATADTCGPFPLGTTTVTWSATDPFGVIVTARQAVTIEDTTPPDITVHGANPASFFCEFGVYVDEGATARDLVEGDLTSSIVYATVGSAFRPPYFVSYTVQDSSGNQASASRTLNTPCDFGLVEMAPLFETDAGEYPPWEIVLEATGPLTSTASIPVPLAFDRLGVPLDHVVTFNPQGWNAVLYRAEPIPPELPVGDYGILWQAVDAAGVVGQHSQTLRIVDTTPPTLTLSGAVDLTIEVNGAFADPGASAHDIVDGDLTSAITRNGTVNPTVPGLYTMTYRVADSSGNRSEAIRKVTVYSTDVVPPVVVAPPSLTVEATGTLTAVLIGVATAVDQVDGLLIPTPDATGPFPVGTTRITWSARDVAGNVGTAVQTVTVRDTTAPTITAPGNIDTWVAGPTPLFIGAATATDNVSATVTHNAPAVFPIGETLVTWTAVDPSGNSATAVQTIKLALNLPPVAVAGENQTVYQGAIVRLDGSKSTDPDGTIASWEWSEGFNVLSNAAAFSKSDFSLGRHELTLTVVDNHDGWNSATVTVDVKSPTPDIPLALTFDPPIDGIQVTGNALQVSGTFQAPPNAGITVNGHVAALEGNRFYARVPLSAGLNTLTTTLTSQEGKTLTLTPSVTSDGVAPALDITADELEGVESLTVTFTMTNRSDTPLVVSAPELWNNEVTLAPGMSFDWQPTRDPGVWPMRFIVTDSNGLQTEQTFTVVVHERYALDQSFKLLWSGFTAALTTGEREWAMSFLSTKAQAKYGPVFDVLADDLPQVFAAFTTPVGSDITIDVSEYVTVRTIEGVDHLYFIYFTRSYDGVWRLDSM